jgi:hypothetical protein
MFFMNEQWRLQEIEFNNLFFENQVGDNNQTVDNL